MSIDLCPSCKAFTYDGKTAHGMPHVCAPAWATWLPDYNDQTEEDAKMVHAHSAESAAEKAAENAFDDSACEIGTGPHLVIVKRDGVEHRFQVEGEYTTNWNAREEK